MPSLIPLPAEVTGELAAVEHQSLAVRDLQRGLATGLPSGESIARHIGARPLDPDEIGVGEIGWVGEGGGINNARRILSRKHAFPLKISFLEPFDPRDFPGRKAIAAESRRRIEDALVAALGGPLRPFEWAVAPVNYAPSASGA